MREVVLGHASPTSVPARWHDLFEEPWSDEEVEVDVGDRRVWRGVRFSRAREAFVDEDSGAAVPVLMWRYATVHH